jgi:hypothetical protein
MSETLPATTVTARLAVATMATPRADVRQRNVILWLGLNPPELLTAACWQLGLTVQPVQPEELDRCSPDARALVIEVPADDPEFATWGSAVISQGLAHGLRVALVQQERDDDLPRMEDEEAVAGFFAAVKALRRDPSRALAFYRDWTHIGVA